MNLNHFDKDQTNRSLDCDMISFFNSKASRSEHLGSPNHLAKQIQETHFSSYSSKYDSRENMYPTRASHKTQKKNGIFSTLGN